MSDNETVLTDEDGDFSDWIELYNNNDFSINLINYKISDNYEEPYKWTFPEIIIQPHNFIVVFASGKDRHNTNELHTNFKISSSGEKLFLSNSYGVIIDQVTPVELSDNQAYGQVPDGSNNWIHLFNPSPGSSNNLNNHISFSADAGFYTTPFYLKFTSLIADNIFYTLDGSIPTDNSNIYTDSLLIDFKYSSPNYFSEFPTSPNQSLISYTAWKSPSGIIDKASIIRCATYNNGVRTSNIYTQTYFVDSTILEKYNIPLISLVSDEENLFNHDTGIYVPGIHYDSNDPNWTGNYFQKGDNWERPVHIEYFGKNGNIGFSQDAGIRINGQLTRHAAQKSVKLYARNKYGNKYFNYQLFPQKENTEYKRFLLRSSMGSWGGQTIIKDVLAHEIARNLDFEYQDYQPVVVFINGEYWGIHTIRDKIDERYIGYTYNLNKDSIDLIAGNYKLIDAGSNEHYVSLLEFIELNDLTIESNYEYVKSQIEINSFIDYHIAEMFFSNHDWPSNNLKLWRPQTPDGKWRWIFYDIDAGFGNPEKNMFVHTTMNDSTISWPNPPWSTFLFRNLLKNESFVEQFINRYAEILNSDFSLNTMITKLNTIKSLYENEVPRNSKRWNYPNSFSNWEWDIEDDLLYFIENRSCIVEKNISGFFNISDFGFTCNYNYDISDSLIIGPNPNNGNFFIKNISSGVFLVNISITNITGQIVFIDTYLYLGFNKKHYFNLSGLSNGAYIINFYNSLYSGRKKIIILK